MAKNQTILQAANHTILALLIQGGVWLLTGNLVYGALLAIAYFYGREFAQAEYRYMQQNYCTRRVMSWWTGFDLRNWTYDAFFNDLLYPAIAVCAVCLFIVV